MKRLVLLVALIAALTASAAQATTIYVGSHSEEVTQQQLAGLVPTFQTMLDRDLAPAWQLGPMRLTTNPAEEKTADMVTYLEDFADCLGCLGYHDVVGGRPTGYTFVEASIGWNEAWPLVFTHELQEMVVDPWINRGAYFKKRWWLVEVSDPVESGQYAYFINGVPISDFILPSWYGGKKPFDFTHALTKPGQIARHGYASWWNPATNDWDQVFGYHAKK